MLPFSSRLPAGKNSPGFLCMWCIYSVRGSECCPSGSHLRFGEETASPCSVLMCSFHTGEAPALPTGSAQSRSRQWDLGEPVPAVGTVLGPAGMPAGITHGMGMWETQNPCCCPRLLHSQGKVCGMGGEILLRTKNERSLGSSSQLCAVQEIQGWRLQLWGGRCLPALARAGLAQITTHNSDRSLFF